MAEEPCWFSSDDQFTDGVGTIRRRWTRRTPCSVPFALKHTWLTSPQPGQGTLTAPTPSNGLPSDAVDWHTTVTLTGSSHSQQEKPTVTGSEVIVADFSFVKWSGTLNSPAADSIVGRSSPAFGSGVESLLALALGTVF
jgi:hypothetical protein